MIHAQWRLEAESSTIQHMHQLRGRLLPAWHATERTEATVPILTAQALALEAVIPL